MKSYPGMPCIFVELAGRAFPLAESMRLVGSPQAYFWSSAYLSLAGDFALQLNDSSMFRDRRPIEVVVLSCWVTEDAVGVERSTSLAKSTRERVNGRPC
jgi:hypothetical protein